MKNTKVLLYSTIAGLFISYIPGLVFSPSGHVKTDCGKYSHGKGLDVTGKPFQDFWSFYPYYVCEHQQPRTKLFHFIASLNVLCLLANMTTSGFNITTPILGLFQGYGLAWISHFWIEKNKPATWQYPGYSFAGDFVLFSEVLSGEYIIWE
ncbi:uncharacterized protein LOC111705371 [Eurytemora carolleeae]|uniref:uncharacterized protein LOC111705371 n=1 Tax=Eurytemora carolleeae TaxID=1294199 RepID=UPI000C779E04|nr:uncharacterized protein LOC111705371 [Eurytemora carolleeae]|eukprot:XP_023333654.1 uncharacterized protein LOC111705371 [Eurytemora affinis]